MGDVPEPRPVDGAVLVAVDAAALNPVELHIANGRYRDGLPQLPYTPGVEGVGRVLDGAGLEPGARVRFEVLGLHPGYGTAGSLAERTLAIAESVVAVPDAVDDGTAASLGSTGITAWRLLEVAAVRPGETVLVLGATGAVGRAAVQLSRSLGAAHVVAAGRSAAGLDRAAQLGADATVRIEPGHERSALAAAMRHAANDRIDVVLDALWGEPALAALEAASVDVRLVNVGRAAGDPIELPHPLMLRKRALVRGLSTAMDPPPVRRAAFARLLDEVIAGRLVIDREIVGLDDIADAWARQARSGGRKIVVRIT